jgi:hypothetical protein
MDSFSIITASRAVPQLAKEGMLPINRPVGLSGERRVSGSPGTESGTELVDERLGRGYAKAFRQAWLEKDQGEPLGSLECLSTRHICAARLARPAPLAVS